MLGGVSTWTGRESWPWLSHFTNLVGGYFLFSRAHGATRAAIFLVNTHLHIPYLA